MQNPASQPVMKNKRLAAKIARARSQLYLDAIANFIEIESSNPTIQADDRLMVKKLKEHADRWRLAAK
jgi:hypothetical protein